MAKCFSCGKDADAKEDLCHGCWNVVCVECVNKYDHMGNGKHGRRRTKRAPDRLAGGGRKHPARAIKQIRKLLVKNGGR